MDIVAAYFAGILTPLIVLNGWYVATRLRRGYQDTRPGRSWRDAA